MIIVRIFGGLGNQMFQYALYHVMRTRGLDTYVDLSWYNNRSCHNGYELGTLFSVLPRTAQPADINRLAENENNILWKVWHRFIRRKDTFYCKYGKDAVRFFPEVFCLDEKYISGYWQSEKYFKNCEDDIRKLYSFAPFDDLENNQIAMMAKNTESVSLHVRRGDYLNEPLLKGICEDRYYEAAMKEIYKKVDKPVFFVFSNDIPWCREHFTQNNIIFINNNTGANSFRDMQLMSLCKHHIIANSSFSWWGAWLGAKNGITIAPKKWFNGVTDSEMDIYPQGWVCI